MAAEPLTPLGELSRATEEWSPPRFEAKARVRRLPVIHWLAEAVYRLPLWLGFAWFALRSRPANRRAIGSLAATLGIALFAVTGVVLAIALAVAR